MTTYIATSEMCHPEMSYDENLLPHDWPGKAFRLRDEDQAVLVNEHDSQWKSWVISKGLADKIKASPETELQRMRELLAAKDEELRTFKRRVAEVAMEYATRHDWCDAVKEALDEIGVEVPAKEYEFTLSVVYRVRGTKETYENPDTYDLQQYVYLNSDITMSMDGWGDFEVEYVQHDVMDIVEIEEND